MIDVYKRQMQQFALVSALFIFGGIGYRLMTKLDAIVEENERHQKEKEEESQ